MFDVIYFLYSAFSCLIVFGILCLIWDEYLMKIKAFLLLLCMFFVLCFAITLPFCFWYSWLSHVYISLWIWIWETFWIKENVAVLPRRKVMRWKKKILDWFIRWERKRVFKMVANINLCWKCNNNNSKLFLWY